MHSRKAAWMQGATLVAALAVIALAVMVRTQRPLDRDTLAIQVAQLQSSAAEAQLLVDNARADRLAPGFVRQHARQMAGRIDATNGKLRKPVQPELSAQKAQAERFGASLRAGVSLLGRDGSARTADFDATVNALGALHRQIKPDN